MKKIIFILTIILMGIGLYSCDLNNGNSKRQEKVDEVINVIDSLPDAITLDDEQTINTAFTLYNALSSEEKKLVTNYLTLCTKQVQLEELLEDLNNQKIAKIVIDLINQLPNNVTLNDKELVENAYNEFNKLSYAQRNYVTNFDRLQEIKAKYDELVKEEAMHKAKADVVIYLINDLPSDVQIEYEDAINYALENYNLLTDYEKTLVTNYNELVEKLEMLENLKFELVIANIVNPLIDSIEKLPNTYEVQLSDEEDVLEVYNTYLSLEKDIQYRVTNKDKLVELIKIVNEFKAVKTCISNINKKLSNIYNLTYDDRNLVYSLLNEYNNLNDYLKTLVANVNVLNQAVERIDLLEIEYNQAIEVFNKISLLPSLDSLELSDKYLIIDARNSYESLTNVAKSYVTNIDILIELEEKIYVLENITTLAQEVIDKIAVLPSVDHLEYADKSLIVDIRNSFENLTDEGKSLVYNIYILENAEQKINELEEIEISKLNALVVVELINTLPSDITESDIDLLYKCFEEYNKLTKTEQSYVTNYDELLLKKEKYEEIIASTKYEVKVELNGGYLENMIEVNKTETICEFSINNYSCNVWSLYTTNIFIYKTSLMKSEDKFTSFLKVGLNYDNESSNYKVVQIVKSGTALEENLRTSDYYILAHSDYALGYSNVVKIELNNVINLDKQLPDKSTDSLDCKVVVLSTSNSSEYFISMNGLNTLPIPTKQGYKFMGWYLEDSFINEVQTVSSNCTIYAKWTVDKGEVTTENILNSVSDVATSNTIDELILENNDAYFSWSSSNNKLYNISNGIGSVSKVYQTHKKQTVTVSVEVSYKTGGKKTLSKEITVDPVLFNSFSKTPIATYFYTGAVSAYKKYNERYLTNQTLFSETTKETLDIVYYAFIVPKSDGSVSMQNTSYLDEVKELKNHNVRILGCVNGVGTDTSTAFKVITADANLRKTFINNLMDMVEQYNLDGLDLDWEAISSTLKPIASQYNLLCEELRAEMTRRQDEGGSPYLLTLAVPASSYGTASDRFDFKTLNKYCDFINIMSYDLNDTTKASHLSPLYTSKKDNGYGFGAVYGVERISSLGFDKNKLIIGCAGYGKAYKVSSATGTYPALGTTASLTQISGLDGSYASGTVYGSAINQLIKTGRYVEYTELDSNGRVVGSYLYSKTDNIFITYDSKTAVMAKYEYAASIGVGMMCWAYTEDTSDTVIDAIYEAKNK